MTVAQLLASLSAAELTEWQAYFVIQQRGVPNDPDEKLQQLFGKSS